MSMLSVLIKDLVEKTTLEDGTYLVAGNTDANKITFLNLVNAIKKKLGAAAQKSVANNLTTAAAGTSVLDAYQGKLLSDKIDKLNSTLTWSNWISLGQNALGIFLLYRYNAYEVELSYRGNLKAGVSIGGGSAGWQWSGFPTELKPPYNFEAPIYSVVGDNPKLSLRFFPDNGTITITSHITSKTSEEYISGFYRYTRR